MIHGWLRSVYAPEEPELASRGPRESARAAGQPSDAAITAGLSRGETWAADALYARVHTQIERTLRRLLRFQASEIDDLMQASFERMFRFLGERPLASESNLSAWASAVATNVALDFLRRRGSERRLMVALGDVEAVRGEQAGPDRKLEARRAVARMQGHLARLGSKYAEVLILHDVLGHELAEIAMLMGATVAATQSRLVRGRKMLLRRIRKTERER